MIKRIKEDMVRAMKEGKTFRKEVLRFLLSLIQTEEARVNKPMDETDILAVLQKEMKRKKESLEAFEKANRTEMVADQKKEIAILEEYLPKMMSRDQIMAKVGEIVADQKTANFGQVMGMVMGQLKGKADGKMIAEVVKEVLG